MKNSVDQFLFGASQFFKTSPHAEAYQGIFPKKHLQALFFAKKDLEKKEGETESDAQRKSEERIEKINRTLEAFASAPSEEAQSKYPDPVVEIINDYQQLASDRASVSVEQLSVRQDNLNQRFNSFVDRNPAPLAGLMGVAGQAVAAKAAAGIAPKILAAVVGVVNPVVGVITTFVGKEVISKAITWVIRNKERFLQYIGGGVAIGGLLIGGTVGTVSTVAGIGMVGVGMVGEAGGAGAAIGNLASAGGAALTAITTATLGAIAVPLIAAVIGIPVVVALILFIINSGAYVMPGGLSRGIPGQTCISPGTENVGSPSGVVNLPTCSVGCFKFEQGWPAAARTSEEQAINSLSKDAIYMDKLCSKGEIILRWGGGDTGGISKGGDVLAGPNIITIYTLGVGSLPNSLYTLSHESGHIFARRYGDIYRQYTDTVGVGNILICTYPLQNSPGESFAEMISLYASRGLIPGTRHFDCMGGKTFKEAYPQHWKFARDYIFQEELGW